MKGKGIRKKFSEKQKIYERIMAFERNGLNFEFALSKTIWYELWLLLMLIIIETNLFGYFI